jgi:integrase
VNAAPTILLHSNGAYWHAVWHDAQGQRHKRSLGAKRKITRVAALVAIGQLAKELEIEATGGLPTLAALAAVNAQRTSTKAITRTIAGRSVALLCQWARAAFPAGDATPIDLISKADASAFAAWLHEHGTKGELGRPMNPTTIGNHLRVLRGLWYVVAEPLPVPLLNPWAKRRWSVPTVAHDWHDVPRETLARLMAATEHPGVRMQLALCRLAGLRSGEARRLRWRDVDLSRRVLTILPEIGAHGQRVEGTKQRARTVPISPDLAVLLDAQKAVLAKVPFAASKPNGLVCPDLPTPTNVHRMLVGGKAGTRTLASGKTRRYIGLFEKAGLTPWDRPLHTLRKCCGTDWGEMGIPLADIAAWMGNSPDVAARLYLRTTPTTWARVTGLTGLLPQTQPQAKGKAKATKPKPLK